MDAAWLDDGRIIGLVTMGSSGCVPAAEEATLEDDGTLSVTLVEPDADTACTADFVPRVTLVEVPEGVDPAEDLAITVTGDGYDRQHRARGRRGARRRRDDRLPPERRLDRAPTASSCSSRGARPRAPR